MFFKIVNFIPNDCLENIFQIDYNNLYKNGKRVIFIDLDNTLIPYDQIYINDKIEVLFEEIRSYGLEIVIISNNKKSRIEAFLNGYNIPFVYKATKPLNRGFKKALNIYSDITRNEVIVIGDQIITDVLGAKRMGIDVILVKPIKKNTEKWYTKVLRYFEKKALNKIKKYDITIYSNIISVIGEHN